MLRQLVAKLPLSVHTKNRLKEIYRKWRLTAGNYRSSSSHSSASTTHSTVDIKRESIADVFRTRIDGVKDDSLKIYFSFDEYQADADQRKKLREKRSEFERSLMTEVEQPFTYSGYCSVCNTKRNFEVDYLYAYERNHDDVLIPNWRESLVCESCRMNNRIRAVADLMQHQIKLQPDETIYATEQLTAFYQWLIQQYSNVIGSEFLGDDKTGGETYNNLRHEDITALSFSDSSIDAILSFEVLEHVPDTTSSINEFLRVMRKGGLALVSAPFASNNYETIVRARVSEEGEIEHILEPEYHGNPTNPEEGSLCFYHFGWDLVDKFKSAGASDAAVVSYYSIDNANLGNEQLFFLILK